MAVTLTYDGKPACTCQVRWLTVFSQLLALLGMPPLRIAQLIGNAPASMGRHLGGFFVLRPDPHTSHHRQLDPRLSARLTSTMLHRFGFTG